MALFFVYIDTYDEAKEKLAIALDHSDVEQQFLRQASKENRSQRHKKPTQSDFTSDNSGDEDEKEQRSSKLKMADFPTAPTTAAFMGDYNFDLTI